MDLERNPSRTNGQPDPSSLYVFPGRDRCRYGISFDKVDRKDCTKIYVQEDSAITTL